MGEGAAAALAPGAVDVLSRPEHRHQANDHAGAVRVTVDVRSATVAAVVLRAACPAPVPVGRARAQPDRPLPRAVAVVPVEHGAGARRGLLRARGRGARPPPCPQDPPAEPAPRRFNRPAGSRAAVTIHTSYAHLSFTPPGHSPHSPRPRCDPAAGARAARARPAHSTAQPHHGSSRSAPASHRPPTAPMATVPTTRGITRLST